MSTQLDMFAPVPEPQPAITYVAQSRYTHAMQHRNCRSCGALVWWVHTEAGKRMPLDYQPDPRGLGNVIFTANAQVRYVKREESGLEEPRYTSHFATCPDSEQHRKRNTPVSAAEAPQRIEVPEKAIDSVSATITALEAKIEPLAMAYGELLEQNCLLENQIQPLVEARDRISWQPRPWPEDAGDRLLELGAQIAALRHQKRFRQDSMRTIAEDLRSLLDERDRTARGAFAAGANRPVVLRLSDRARDLRGGAR